MSGVNQGGQSFKQSEALPWAKVRAGEAFKADPLGAGGINDCNPYDGPTRDGGRIAYIQVLYIKWNVKQQQEQKDECRLHDMQSMAGILPTL